MNDAMTNAETPRSARRGYPPMSLAAKAYFALVVAAAAAVAGPLMLRLHSDGVGDWSAFAVLAGAAALAHLFVVFTPRNQSCHTTIVFLIPAIVMLHPELLALIPLVQHVPEWLKKRYPWPIQTFNIANYTLNVLAAWAVTHVILAADGAVPNGDLRFALAAVAGSAVFLFLNHGILALMLKLARGHSVRETGLFGWESLSTEGVLAMLGIALAAFWLLESVADPAALAPSS